MNFIKIENGSPVKYSISQLKRDNLNISFPSPITLEVLAIFDVFPLTLIAQPSFDPATQKIVEIDAVFENNEWTQTWSVVDLEGAELIEAQAIADAKAAEIARLAAKAQAYIDNLPSWAGVETVIDNITDLAGAKAFLVKLARVVYWDVKNTEI